MRDDAFLRRARTRGVNPLVYWLCRAVVQPFSHLYWRLSRIGREHIPAEGGVILAANHRSFLDPFVIALMCRRPVYFVSKRELFERRGVAWLLSALGAFPINRGASDEEAMATAREIIERGDPVLIFPEGTRVRPGGLGSPRRGVGRLALQTGAPVVPVAITGTEDVRDGWRIRPRKLRIRAGQPLRFPLVAEPSAALAGAVAERIWPCVALQWEWLGGTPPLRRAVVVGAGAWGTSAAETLARAGLSVQLGCRTPAQAASLAPVPPAGRLTAHALYDVDFEHADLVVLAVPTAELPGVVAEHGARFGARAGVLVLARGLIDGAFPAAYVAAHTHVRGVAALTGPTAPADLRDATAHAHLAASTAGLAHELKRVLVSAGLGVELTRELADLELAGAAAQAAVLAARTALPAGPGLAGAAADRVLAEVGRVAGAGLPGATGELVGRLAARPRLQEADAREARRHAEAGATVLALADALEERGLRVPVLRGLADVVAGHRPAAAWTASLTRPAERTRRAA